MLAVFSEISKWAQKLPYWQQFALSQILGGSRVDDELCEKVFTYFSEDIGIANKELERPVLRFLEQVDFTPTGARPKLKSIGNVQNVNALVGAQTLTMGSNLTTVFGSNGAGKSGYARILASAGFSRGIREVLSDATKEEIETASMFAEIGFDAGSINYQIGTSLNTMSGYFVFDSESIPAHLTKANAISFSPAGLSSLKDLVAIIENMAKRLETLIGERRSKSITVNISPGESSIKPLVLNLSAETDLGLLRRMAVFGESDESRLKEVESEFTRLVQQDVAALVKRNETMDRDLRQLLSEVGRIENLCTETFLNSVIESINAHRENLAAAKTVSIEQFRTNRLNVIGSAEWDQFVKLAHKLALQQASESESYPSKEDVCLLCHQPLSEGARELLERTFQYAEGEAQRKVGQSAIVIENLKTQLKATGIEYGTARVSYEYVLEKEPGFPTRLSELNNLAGKMASQLSSALANLTTDGCVLVTLPSCKLTVETILDRLITDRTCLIQENVEEVVASLRKQQTELRHRKELSAQISLIEVFVLQEQNCSEMLSKTPKTQGVTTKHNQLFNEIVTDKYVALFKEYLDSFLGGAVRIGIKTSGSKGETLRQIVLEGAGKSKLNLTKVLSEGEQRAVALADFLTEVTLNEECDGVILDDPVTSFALEWRETAAKLISQIAQKKQIVVLTHDLAFLYWLHKYADTDGVGTESHWMMRGQSDGKPGYVYLNNSPVCEKVYRDATKANEWYKKAKDAEPHNMQLYTQQGFGALRTSYEVLVIDVLFRGVVKRFEERVSVDSLKDIKWNQSLVDKLMQNYAQLCRCMEGHSHSDSLSSGIAQPRDLFDAITKFEELRKQLKNPEKVTKLNPLKIVETEVVSDPLVGL